MIKQLLKNNVINYLKVDEDQKYFLKIKIADLNQDTISDIKNQLIEMNKVAITNNIDKIINCLKGYYSEEEKSILPQLDFFWFDQYNLPLLEIQNINAKSNQKNKYSNNYFGYRCRIDKF